MTATPLIALYGLWIVWYASWVISIFWSGRVAARPRPYMHILYQIPTAAGVILLFWPETVGIPIYPLWTAPDMLGWIAFALTAVSFAFCWWARVTMGRLWSGYISRTDNHRVIDTGPFAIVRHPIYTGVISAAFLLAGELGTLDAFLGASLLLAAFYVKARVEERFLGKELGEESYASHRRKVPMLVPFWPKPA